METQSDGHGSEKVTDAFLCCVCLDLLYKPVVLACGHASCFWCVHNSMSGLRESHCPLCHHPYQHFPTICQMLHALLLKMYPFTYKKRENQILEEEKEMGCFSPSFDDIWASVANKNPCNMNVQAQSSITMNGQPCQNVEQFKSVQNSGPTIVSITESNRASPTGPVDQDELPQTSCSDILHQILIDDVLCAACKQLLYRPIVLNCGHVYCESCLTRSDGSLKCQICQSSHPRGFPKVYLELDHFLEDGFPTEYLARKRSIQQKEVQFQHEGLPKCSAKDGDNGVPLPSSSDKSFLHWCADNGSEVHFGVGCDYCGMFPIIGDRYRCKDCKEAIGFDLCGDCYSTQSKQPGRFNQQHTPDHRFETVKSSPPYNIIFRLLRDPYENGTQTPFLVPDVSENLLAYMLEIVQGNPENVVVGPSTPGITEDHQDDDDTQHTE